METPEKSKNKEVFTNEEAVAFLTFIHEINHVFHVGFPSFELTGALLMTSPCCVLFFCGGLMAPTGELAPPAAYLHEPSPNTHTTVVDLVKICTKFGSKLDIRALSYPLKKRFDLDVEAYITSL